METEQTTPAGGPKKYGRYIVQKLIGEGAMGSVFLAQDPVLNRQVAIKVITMERQLDGRTRTEYLSRFALEARLSAQLNHQSIVPVYDAGEEGGVPWIAFQYVDGVTLDKIIKGNGKLSVPWAVRIALDVASALQAAHGMNVVHRDIKPANIIVDRHGGIAKLMDFGVAKVPWTSLTCEGNAMGSPGYMSPEQIEGFSIDERSDLFSLGVVLYEMVAGRHPFVRETVEATAFATVSGSYTPLCEVGKDVPRQVIDAVDRCLITSPDKRIRSAVQFIELLRSLDTGIDSVAGTRTFFTGRPIWVSACVRKAADLMAAAVRQVVRRSGYRAQRRKPAAAGRPAGVHGKSHAGMVLLEWTARRCRRFYRKAAWEVRGFYIALRRGRRNALYSALGLFIATAVISLAITSAVTRNREGGLFLPLGGLDRQGVSFVNKCRTWLSAGNYDSAAACADALAATENGAARGHFLRAIIACREMHCEEAAIELESAGRLPGGAKLLERNRAYMVAMALPLLKKDRVPDSFVSLLSGKLGAADDPIIKNAVYERPYWMRWNSVHILQAAGKQVDMVLVYILDLQYSKTLHTRLQAVRELRSLGDRRAVPALKESRDKGIRDLFVSSAASTALKEVFKEQDAAKKE